MLSAVADYKFVEPQNIIIDGGLIPFRQGDAKKVLRGEDAAFLREAACRVAYLTNHSSTTSPVSSPTWEYFEHTTGPKCGGICNQAILGEPLSCANRTFLDSIGWYALDFLNGSDYIVFETSAMPSLETPLPEALSVDIDPSIIPDHCNSFQHGKPLLGHPIEELVNCVSAFVHPTQRHDLVQNVSNETGVLDQWMAKCERNYLVNSEGANYTPQRQRYKLEAVYSECVHVQENSEWSAKNGSRTWSWNKNFPNEWYTALYMPCPNGIQWTDRDGTVHNADKNLTPLLIEHSWEWTQAIFEFRIMEQWKITRDNTTVDSKNIDRTVFVPVELKQSDLNDGKWEFDVSDMWSKAWGALAAAGGEYISIAFLRQRGMQNNDYAGGSTRVILESVHGIYTMNEDLTV